MCLQRCRWQYWSIFIRLAVVGSEICETPRNFLIFIEFKFIYLSANRKRIYFPNSNFGRISYRFRGVDAFSSKMACFPTPPLFDAP